MKKRLKVERLRALIGFSDWFQLTLWWRRDWKHNQGWLALKLPAGFNWLSDEEETESARPGQQLAHGIQREFQLTLWWRRDWKRISCLLCVGIEYVSIDSLMKKRLKEVLGWERALHRQARFNWLSDEEETERLAGGFRNVILYEVSIDSLMKKRLKAHARLIPPQPKAVVSIDSLMKKRLKGNLSAYASHGIEQSFNWLSDEEETESTTWRDSWLGTQAWFQLTLWWRRDWKAVTLSWIPREQN